MRLTSVILLALAIGMPGAPRAAGCREAGPDTPRVLVMAVDGVPLRAMQEARVKGAFADWPEPEPMISAFPSVTNVAFTALFHPFGVDPAGGYEVAHFDVGENKVIGGSPFGYEDRLYAWRDVFDVTSRTMGSKFKTYTAPKRSSRHAVDLAEAALYESPDKELILAHIGATDAMIHLRGDKAIVKYLMELDDRLAEMKQAHLAQTGRRLSVVLLSDHGNSSIKIHKAGGLKKALRRSGLRVAEHLEEPGTVVAPTFGIVGYGALFTHREDAATAGRAVVGNRSVDLAAWLDESHQMIVESNAGGATVRWREDPLGGWSISYEAGTGDPLELIPVIERLREQGMIDEEGFAHEDVWFDETLYREYPDGMRRLIHSLIGTWVRNYATVVFSLKPGYAWGWTSAHVSSKLSGGRLEGTHGGLDADSTVGFIMADDPNFHPTTGVRADRALAPFADFNECLVVTGDDDHTEQPAGAPR